MSRILYVTGTLGGGGSERQLAYLVRALRLQEHEVTVAVWNFQEDDPYVAPIRATGASVLPLSGSLSAKAAQLRRAIRERAVEVIHAYTFYLNPVVALASVGTGALSVGSVRSALVTAAEMTGPVSGGLASRYPRRQIYNSAGAVREAETRRFFRPKRILHVANHLDVDSFPARRLPDAPSIAAVGSLLPYKRWDRLIAACARLRDAGIEAQLQIAGEGPIRAELQAQINALGLTERITLLGYCSDVKSVIGNSWFLAHTSETEGSPNVVIEALALGRAVVATPVGDVPVFVREGETGYLVTDVDTLSQRMATLLCDREACIRMGERARELARDRFGAGSFATEMLEAYRMLGWT